MNAGGTKLREEIARTREEITLSTQVLRDSLSRQLDWREQVRGRPLLWLGLSFALGWVLGRGYSYRGAKRAN